jgi:hypothetical protein
LEFPLFPLRYTPTANDDDFEGPPPQSWFPKWVWGIALPLWLAAYGLRAMVTGEAHLAGRQPMDLHGCNATAVGVAAISLALFLHCHYFWGNIYAQGWYAQLGKIIAAVGFIAGLGFLLVQVGVMGRN